MLGKCLCGEVQFQVVDEIPNLYQCHCSLCQKTTGSTSCSSFLVGVNGVKWINGKENITSFKKENGFQSDFCSACGSPVPNKMNIGEYMWVPAGLIEGDLGVAIAAQIHLNSKATWEAKLKDQVTYSDSPSNIEQFMVSLKKSKQ